MIKLFTWCSYLFSWSWIMVWYKGKEMLDFTYFQSFCMHWTGQIYSLVVLGELHVQLYKGRMYFLKRMSSTKTFPCVQNSAESQVCKGMWVSCQENREEKYVSGSTSSMQRELLSLARNQRTMKLVPGKLEYIFFSYINHCHPSSHVTIWFWK